MALPTTIYAGSEWISQPFKSSGGNIYVLTKAGLVGLHCYKATDPTSSFSLVDDANRPVTVGGSAGDYIAVFQVGDVLHIAAQYTDASGMTVLYPVQYHTFNMGTDAWGTKNESVDATNTSGSQTGLDITVDQSGNIVIIYRGLSDTIMGTDYRRVDYAKKSGGSWSSGNALDSGGEINYYPAAVVRGGTQQRVHFFYTTNQNGQVVRRTILANGTLASSVAVGSYVFYQFTVRASSYDASGTLRIGFAGVNGGNGYLQFLHRVDSDNDESWTEETIKTSGFGGIGYCRVVQNGTGARWTVYKTATPDNDLYAITNDGSGWGGDALIEDTSSTDTFDANTYDRSGAKLAVTWRTASAVMYDEHALSSSNTYTYVGSGGLSFAGAAVLSKEKIPVATGGVSFSGAAVQNREKVFTPSGGIQLSGTATTLKSITYSFIASGGFVFAGVALTQKVTVHDYIPSGGIQLSGTSLLSRTKIPTTSGGIVFSGTSLISKLKSPSSSGGVVFSGAATTSYQVGQVVYSYTGSGGLTLSGTAIRSRTKEPSLSGGVSLSGTALVAKERVASVSGGFILSGIAVTQRLVIRTFDPSGGITLSGAAVWSREKSFGPTGGVTFSGIATTVWFEWATKLYPTTIVDVAGYTREDGSNTEAALLAGLTSADAQFDRSPTSPSSTFKTRFTSLNTRPGLALKYEYGKDQSGGNRIDQKIQLRNGLNGVNLVREVAHTNVGVRPITGSMDISDLSLAGVYEVWLVDTEVGG